MGEMLAPSLPWLPATLGVLVLLFLQPLLGEVGRRRLVACFLLGALALVVLAVQQARAVQTVTVFNVFPVGPDMRPTPIAIETVTAAGWQWPVVAAGFLALLALWTFATVRLPAAPPAPVARCVVVPTLFVVLRLLLEKTAAPAGLAWAVGGSIGLPIVVGFAGWYAGRRRQGLPAFALALLLLAVLQRAIVSAIGYVVTSRHLGTHLDVNAITELDTPVGGMRHFGADPLEKWWWAVAVPQMVPWVVITLVTGFVVGGLAFAVARRR